MTSTHPTSTDLPVAETTLPVTVVWRSPDALRDVDQVMARDGDHEGWLRAMDAATNEADGRFGLTDRIDTEILSGEPVLVHEERDGWSCVTAPWQPHHSGETGYPGWVPSGHLTVTEHPEYPWPEAELDAGVQSVVDYARRFVGLSYLWGGISPTGLDCSGLVHLACRVHGVVVPRDAGDQRDACTPVDLDDVRLGDLYFFGPEQDDVTHVGFVTGHRAMIHAPGTGKGVVEEPLKEHRRSTLLGAGRIPQLS